MEKALLIRAEPKKPEGPPWPARVSARERLERELRREESLERDPADANGPWLNARFGHALRQMASEGDVEGLRFFYRAPGVQAIVERSDVDWIGALCEKGAPEAQELMIREWAMPCARGQREGARGKTLEGAMRCAKAALSGGEERGSAMAAARELCAAYRAEPVGLALSWSIRMAAPKMTLENFELAAGWALEDEEPRRGDGPALQIAMGLSQQSSMRRGERDREGLARAWLAQSAFLRAVLRRHPACGPQWSELDAWSVLSLFAREEGCAQALVEAERAWSPPLGFAGFDPAQALERGERGAAIFPGLREQGAQAWLARRHSVVSLALLMGNREGAREMSSMGAHWRETDHFEWLGALEAQADPPMLLSERERRGMRQAWAWGEELALERSAGASAPAGRAPGRSI